MIGLTPAAFMNTTLSRLYPSLKFLSLYFIQLNVSQVPSPEEQKEPLVQVHVQGQGRLQGPQQQEGQEGEEGGEQEQEQIIERSRENLHGVNNVSIILVPSIFA